jgi:hypothetical protein
MIRTEGITVRVIRMLPQLVGLTLTEVISARVMKMLPCPVGLTLTKNGICRSDSYKEYLCESDAYRRYICRSNKDAASAIRLSSGRACIYKT